MDNVKCNHRKLREIFENRKDLHQKHLSRQTGFSGGHIADLVSGKNKGSNKETLLAIIEGLIQLGVPSSEAWQVCIEVDGDVQKNKKQRSKTMILDQKLLKHFNFRETPLQAGGVNKKELYLNANLKRLNQLIIDTAKSNRFIIIAGDTGVGKSVLLKNAIDYIIKRERKVKTVVINPFLIDELTPYDIVDTIIESLTGEKPAFKKSDRVKEMGHLLYKLGQQNYKITLIIDEAQDLHARTLRSIKRLWEGILVHDGKLSVILVGRDSMLGKLGVSKRMKEVDTRTEQFTMKPFLSDDKIDSNSVKEYIGTRLAAVGSKNIFSEAAIHKIIQRTNTIQDINNLCLRALAEAGNQGMKEVNDRIVDLV